MTLTHHSTRTARLLTTATLFLLIGAGVWLVVGGSGVRAQSSGQQNALQATPVPLPLYALPDGRTVPATSSNTLALANDARTLVTVNMLSNSITVLIPSQSRIISEIPVGLDPRSVALTPDDTRALTANRGDHTLSVVSLESQAVVMTVPLGGLAPYGVVAGVNERAYVSLQNTDEIAVVDLTSGSVVERIPVPDAPAGLALWGDFLYVTHLWSGTVSLVYLPQARPAVVIRTGLDTGLSQSMAIDTVEGLAYLPQTRMNAQNANLTYDSTAFPVVNVLNLRDLNVQRQARITLDTADRPVNMPFAAAVDSTAQTLYVANAGTNDVSVIDLETGLARAHIDVGANPRGILLNRDSTQLYVHNVLDGTLTIIQTSSLDVVDVLPVSNLTVANDIFIGAQLFHSADDPRLSRDGWLSCATCHFDGQTDGRVWVGFPGGPRNTPHLYALPETLPYTWVGEWDELADVELHLRAIQRGTGLIDGEPFEARGEPNTGVSPDLDTLVAYLIAIQPPSSPPIEQNPVFARGADVFAAQGCGECHVGTVGTTLQPFDVGTMRSLLERHGAAFDTPSLRWLWMSAPYFHDGAAPTLREVFTLPGTHQLLFEVPPEDIDALVAFLQAWQPVSVP